MAQHLLFVITQIVHGAEYREWATDESRPVLRRILDIAVREDMLVPRAAYGLQVVTMGRRATPRRCSRNYGGSRYSFGYPVCPNLADQKQLLALLRAEEIGIILLEEDQLDPDQSSSAIVVYHPQAKYFSV